MSRSLDTRTLDQAARDYVGHWFLPTVLGPSGRPIRGRDWVITSLYNGTFKDEFEYLTWAMRGQMGPDAVKEFDAVAEDRFTPRDDAVFEELLARKLAIRPNGERIKGAVGSTQIGVRRVGYEAIEVETLESLRFRKRNKLGKEHRVTEMRVMPKFAPVYAGEDTTRTRNFLADESGALNFNMSAEAALAGLDAILDRLDEGTGAAVIQGRSGAQPADPDAAVTGTLLFTLVMSDPAFNAGIDQANGTVRAAAAAITDDVSADATGTLGYCRVSATNDGVTPLDDHIDGEAGTTGADFNFNTVSIVSGATISMSSYTVTLDQGTTAA